MGKMFKKCIPLFMAVLILFGTVFCDYEKVSATGISDILYYTYFDLINTIYATCGYEMDVSGDEINNHGVTGKQVWDNFCTAVEGTAKFHGKLFKGAMTELYGLAKNATQKGISMSQDLYDMLKDALCDTSGSSGSSVGEFTVMDAGQYSRMIGSLCGCSSYSNVGTLSYSMLGKQVVSGDVKLSIVKGTNRYYLLELPKDAHSFSFEYDSKSGYSSLFYLDARSYKCRYSGGGDIISNVDSTIFTDMSFGSFSGHASWVLQNGHFFFDKSITAKQVSEGACPQEVPETIPWHKEKSIPDEWRIVQPDEHPDKDPEEQPDVLPAVIPFPNVPETPGTSETEETSETPGKDPDKNPDKEPGSSPDKKPGDDKDKNTSPDILINPSTGNYIDPNTGFDIDPKTGFLIDPESGKLIDPKNLPDSGGGSGDLPGAVSGYGDITKLFPFCIPFDIVRLIKGMKAQEAPPVFHFEHRFDSINYTFVVNVDLSDYAKYIKIFRFGMQIFYSLALMFLTIKVSKIFI